MTAAPPIHFKSKWYFGILVFWYFFLHPHLYLVSADQIMPDNARRTRDEDFDYLPSPINQADLLYLLTQQLIYKWNSLPLLLKYVSKLYEFRSDLKSHFTSKYETFCNRNNCYSCSRSESKQYFFIICLKIAFLIRSLYICIKLALLLKYMYLLFVS